MKFSDLTGPQQAQLELLEDNEPYAIESDTLGVDMRVMDTLAELELVSIDERIGFTLINRTPKAKEL